MTLNQETGEKEWQKPLEKQEFEHNEEMYSIKTIDSEGKEGELVVSPEHKVYSSSDISYLSSYKIMNFPMISSEEFFSSNLENSLNKTSGLSCGTLNQTIDSIVSLLYRNLSLNPNH